MNNLLEEDKINELDESVSKFFKLNNIEDIVNLTYKFKKGKNSKKLMVSLDCGELEDDNKRSGIDLCMLLDISSSMCGKKIRFLKKSLIYLIDFLEEKDRISIIFFDEKIYPLCNFKCLTNTNKQIITNQINNLKIGNLTNLKNPFEKGFEILKNRNYLNENSAWAILTDGEDTSNNTHQHIKSILEKELNIIESENKNKIPIYTFGFGKHHDDVLLNDISQLSKSKYYYIRKENDIFECFGDFLGDLITILGTNLVINLKLGKDVKVLKTYSNDIENFQNDYTIKNKIIFESSKYNYLFKLDFDDNVEKIMEINLIMQTKHHKDKIIYKELKISNDNYIGKLDEDFIDEFKNIVLNHKIDHCIENVDNIDQSFILGDLKIDKFSDDEDFENIELNDKIEFGKLNKNEKVKELNYQKNCFNTKMYVNDSLFNKQNRMRAVKKNKIISHFKK